MSHLAILGASGHGKVISDIAELNGYEKISFFDDAWPVKSQLDSWVIAGDSDQLIQHLSEFSACIVAIGNNAIRIQKQKELQMHGATIISLIHPRAIVSKYAYIASGSVIMANAVINPAVKIGQGCIVNTAATIDHDCIIADGVHISPGAHLAGNINVGKYSWLGIGCSVKQGLTIGCNVVIGAGAAVVTNIDDGNVAIGVPAKIRI